MTKIATICFIIFSLTVRADSWVQRANLGGAGLAASTGFSIGTKGYIGTGYNFSSFPSAHKDFWEYDQVTNIWTQKANFGGTARSGTVGFSIGNKGYLGTGDDNNVKKDIWEYDPAANTWTAIANLGGVPRNYSVAFVINGFGYIGTGYNSMSTDYNDFWKYDPVSNTWTQKANVGGGTRSSAVGFAINGKGYIGTGYDTGPMNDFWEYDPAANTWTQKANVGSDLRSDAVGFSIGNKGYIGTGYINSTPEQDFWEYDPTNNTWTQKTSLTGPARSDAVGFSINGKGYIGTGDDISFNQLNDFWEYTPDVINPLPVELTIFTAALVNNTVEIKWTTASETNNNYFTVERSKDGFTFIALTTVNSKGNSCSIENYSTVDPYPFTGLSYYRLKQTDFDGHYTYSEITSVIIKAQSILFKAYPNPFAGELHIVTGQEGSFDLQLTDLAGKIIYTENISNNEATFSKTLNLASLPKGTYLLTLQNQDNFYSQKIIKEN